MKVSLILLLLLSLTAKGEIKKSDFNLLKVAIHSAFEDLKENDRHNLVINKLIAPGYEDYWWNLDEVHASYSGYEREGEFFHHIFLFGGFIRLEGMSLDALALTACHELGHGIGGYPYKLSGSSTEGQSDYFASSKCLKVVFNYLSESQTHLDRIERLDEMDPRIVERCRVESKDFIFCVRAMNALADDMSFYKYQGLEVSFINPSLEIAKKLNLENTFYPSAQCRFDTSIAGVLGEKRPRCWFPPGPLENKLISFVNISHFAVGLNTRKSRVRTLNCKHAPINFVSK